MKLKCIRVRNFRRLQDALIDLDPEISIFVGANNSGKTAATQAVQLFIAGNRTKMAMHDFSVACWPEFDAFGEGSEGSGEQIDASACPSISIDFWFDVESADLHRVIGLLPSLDWEGTQVGIRIEFAATDPSAARARYREEREKARGAAGTTGEGGEGSKVWPRTLREYLDERLAKEFEFRYFVLDRAKFDDDLNPTVDYEPARLAPEKGQTGASLLGRLIRIDFVSAQRHLSEDSGGRSENLSRHLGRYYSRNLEQMEADLTVREVLEESRGKLDAHLKRVFSGVMDKLAGLGYPGIDNPKIEIRSNLDPESLLRGSDGAQVFYGVGSVGSGTEVYTLPDHCNGLGFKNLIYMVVQLLDFHSSWAREPESRQPLHLVFVEEPEAHMHAQLQQVFIREILKIMSDEAGEQGGFLSQLVVTTHSSHILYERGFKPIRYFRKGNGEQRQSSDVVNLSAFYHRLEPENRDFLERYLKLTHCDIFFADAAVLVEGNVERLLLPLMIEKAAPRLRSSYLSILEVGGAFAHRFRGLVDILGITTLVVTDIDSVELVPTKKGDGMKKGGACDAVEGAVTTNPILEQWLPGKEAVEDLLNASPEERMQTPGDASKAAVFVVYQRKSQVEWRREGHEPEEAQWAGRTLEESFALENLNWCQAEEREALKLRVKEAEEMSLPEIIQGIGSKVRGSNFGKTDFALALMLQPESEWVVPSYIAEGLVWLEQRILPEQQAELAGAQHGSSESGEGGEI